MTSIVHFIRAINRVDIPTLARALDDAGIPYLIVGDKVVIPGRQSISISPRPSPRSLPDIYGISEILSRGVISVIENTPIEDLNRQLQNLGIRTVMTSNLTIYDTNSIVTIAPPKEVNVDIIGSSRSVLSPGMRTMFLNRWRSA